MYVERASRVPGAVLWRRTVGDSLLRVLPDGCLDLLWFDGRLMIAGPDTLAHLSGGRPGALLAGLRFAPGSGPEVLGVPAHELRNRRIPLDDAWPERLVRGLTDRVGSAADPAGMLEQIALEVTLEAPAARRGGLPDGVLAAVVARLRAGWPVGAIADEVGLTERRLHRHSLPAFGYGAKTLGRILRMNRALELARGGKPGVDVAVLAGYADQAHLSREIKSLAGVPLRVLMAG
jgi:AraC-like DNA-binding protein